MINQKENPYPNGNFSIVADYLEELIKVTSGDDGAVPIPESENGYEEIDFGGGGAAKLNIPPLAVSAEVTVESATEIQSDIVVRYKENGSDPTAFSGIGLGHKQTHKVANRCLLNIFRVIPANPTFDLFVRVQYFTTDQPPEFLTTQLQVIDQNCTLRYASEDPA